MSRSKRIFFITLGSLCVALAAVGTFIPVLPTTPFLLLAAYFYARSSQRFYTWLITNRWFGAYLRNYREGLGLPLRHKVITITLVWLSIGSAVLFVVEAWWLRAALLLIAVGVTLHIARIKTAALQRQVPALVEEPDTPGETG